jgi:WD40 repeat protein
MPDFDPYLTWLGVPPTQRPPTYYQLLGVDPAIIDSAVVKALAIQRIAYVRHFQRGEHAVVCARILEELSVAESVLTDVVKRAAYDKTLKPADPPPHVASRPTVVKAVETPATRPVEPPPRKRKPTKRRETAEGLKWFGGATAALAIIMAIAPVSRMFSGSTQGALAIAFEQPWPDAVVTVDGKPTPAEAGGLNVKLSPGRHAVEVSRGAVGRFQKDVDIVANDVVNLRVPASAFSGTETKPGVAGAKLIIANYRPNPSDAVASVSKGNAKVDSQAGVFTVTIDAGELASGVEITFTRQDYKPQTFRVTSRDVESTSPVEVVLQPTERKTVLEVSPPWAQVTVVGGNAERGENGLWNVNIPGDKIARVTAHAPGYAPHTRDISADGSTRRVQLVGSAAEWWKAYKNLEPNSALRLIGRAGAFGGGARAVALSHNGKFLAVAEGSHYIRVHVWDVERERFVGPSLDLGADTQSRDAASSKAPPIAIAVTGDGKYVALSTFVLCLFDVEAGKLLRRFGKSEWEILPRETKEGETRRAASNAVSKQSADVLSLSFSRDDGKLYSTLRNGKVVVRETGGPWKIVDTLSGFEPGSEDVRFDEAGEFAVANTRAGARLWEKSTGKMKPLDKVTEAMPPGRWSGRPEHEHLFYAPDSSFPVGQRGSEGRQVFILPYDDPFKFEKSFAEKYRVSFVESLSPDHVALIVRRSVGDDSDYGMRIWNATAGKVVAEAFAPTLLYNILASGDGRILATVGEREHVVYLWKFNPKGTSTAPFREPTVWEGPTGLRWTGMQFSRTDGIGATSIQELGGGRWAMKGKQQSAQLNEKRRTPYVIVLHNGNGEELYCFNRGTIWLHKPGQARERKLFESRDVPNFEGYARWPEFRNNAWWEVAFRNGEWSIVDLPPRFPARGSNAGPDD